MVSAPSEALGGMLRITAAIRILILEAKVESGNDRDRHIQSSHLRGFPPMPYLLSRSTLWVGTGVTAYLCS